MYYNPSEHIYLQVKSSLKLLPTEHWKVVFFHWIILERWVLIQFKLVRPNIKKIQSYPRYTYNNILPSELVKLGLGVVFLCVTIYLVCDALLRNYKYQTSGLKHQPQKGSQNDINKNNIVCSNPFEEACWISMFDIFHGRTVEYQAFLTGDGNDYTKALFKQQ